MVSRVHRESKVRRVIQGNKESRVLRESKVRRVIQGNKESRVHREPHEIRETVLEMQRSGRDRGAGIGG